MKLLFVFLDALGIGCLLGRRGLLGEKNGVNVWQNTSTGDGDSTKEAVQFFVILDGEGDVTWHNTALLVITCGVASKFEDLGTEVLKDGGEVYGGTCTHTSGVLSLTEVTTDTTYRKLQTSLGRSGGALLFSAASFSFSRHFRW